MTRGKGLLQHGTNTGGCPTVILAACRCTDSSCFVSDTVYGSQTVGIYSRIGLSRNLYACALTLRLLVLTFLLTNPSLLLAFAVIISKCLFQRVFSDTDAKVFSMVGMLQSLAMYLVRYETI